MKYSLELLQKLEGLEMRVTASPERMAQGKLSIANTSFDETPYLELEVTVPVKLGWMDEPRNYVKGCFPTFPPETITKLEFCPGVVYPVSLLPQDALVNVSRWGSWEVEASNTVKEGGQWANVDYWSPLPGQFIEVPGDREESK